MHNALSHAQHRSTLPPLPPRGKLASLTQVANESVEYCSGKKFQACMYSTVAAAAAGLQVTTETNARLKTGAAFKQVKVKVYIHLI